MSYALTSVRNSPKSKSRSSSSRQSTYSMSSQGSKTTTVSSPAATSMKDTALGFSDPRYFNDPSSSASFSLYRRQASGYGYADDRSVAGNSDTITPFDSISQAGSKSARKSNGPMTMSSREDRASMSYNLKRSHGGSMSSIFGGSQTSSQSEWGADPYYCEVNGMYLREVEPKWARRGRREQR